ncbi:MAG: hypothetical protein U0105_15270 [Candidatus Obscuribacterales bacterium]
MLLVWNCVATLEMLANIDLNDLRAKILSAYRADDDALSTFRQFARRLKSDVRPLRTYSANAISFVSADGGDNRLVFNPAVIEVVRVVDSLNNPCVMDVVAGSISLAELESRAVKESPHAVPPLVRLSGDLGMRLGDLSYLFQSAGQPGKSRGILQTYRDILEWSVLYDLIANPQKSWGSDTILIRDGLLRTKSFRPDVFPKVDRKFRDAVDAHAQRNVAVSLVGVAKQSAVLSRLAVALEIEGTFGKAFPCFVPVPEDIERECYRTDRFWMETLETADEDETGRKSYQSMGRMYLVKFGDRPLDPVWPVDIAAWQTDHAEKILGQLTVDAQQGFPIPDYPMSIQRAHDFAKVGGIEMEILQDFLIEGMCTTLDAEQSERLLRMKHLGRSLASLRYKEA